MMTTKVEKLKYNKINRVRIVLHLERERICCYELSSAIETAGSVERQRFLYKSVAN